jgi:Rrf2 family iron-sulfur cluster assembly transcriptional regulator
MILTDIAKYGNSEVVSPVDISERQQIKLEYVKRLCNFMKNAGFLESFRGKGGGYKLIKDPKDMTMFDIVLASGESVKMTMCSMKGKDYPCNHKQKGDRCLNHGVWGALTIYFSHFLKNITMEEMIVWLEEGGDYRQKILDKFGLKL